MALQITKNTYIKFEKSLFYKGIILNKKSIKSMNKLKLSASILLACVVFVYIFNYVELFMPLKKVIDSDDRNNGIDIQAHYSLYIIPSVLVLDVRNIQGDKSASDVFRILLQFSESMDNKSFDVIELASKGVTKFVLKGDYFKQIGSEYSEQNPVYTMRTFPENVFKVNGDKAFSSWSGGVLGVLKNQMEDFVEFHKQWYIMDMGETKLSD